MSHLHREKPSVRRTDPGSRKSYGKLDEMDGRVFSLVGALGR